MPALPIRSARHCALPLLAILSACNGDVSEPSHLPFTDACQGRPGIAYRDRVAGGVWRSDYARVLTNTVVVDGTLRIEEGVLVCGEAGAALNVASGAELVVEGSEARPVVFTAVDPAAPWGGIGVADVNQQYHYPTGRVAYAVVEHALNGVHGGWTIEHTVVRDIRGYGLRLWDGTVSHSRIERATLDGPGAPVNPYFTPAGLVIPDYGHAELLDVVVRDGGGVGILTMGRTSIRLEDVTIEDNAGTGLFLRSGTGYPTGLLTSGAVRITGNREFGAEVSLRAAAALLAATDNGTALLGNAKDTLVVRASDPGGEAFVPATIPWRITTADWPGIALMTIAPGGHVVFEGIMVHTMVAEGTVEAPITLVGPGGLGLIDPWQNAAAPSTLRHVRINDLGVGVYQGATIEDAVVSGGELFIEQGETTMRRVRIENAPGDAITISAGHLQISDCEITGSGGHAIHAVPLESEHLPLGTPPQITHCNIHDNAGDGVRNERGYQVNARNNWWGDPDGPLGAAGDGVSGDVDYAGWATSPFSVGTGLTQRLTLSARRR